MAHFRLSLFQHALSLPPVNLLYYGDNLDLLRKSTGSLQLPSAPTPSHYLKNYEPVTLDSKPV